MPVPDPVSAFTVSAPVRKLASLCDLARLARCGHCFAGPHQPCKAGDDGRLSGVHLTRLAWAARCGLIRALEVSLVLALVGDTFTSGTVVGGGDPQGALDASRSTGHRQVHADREEAGR
jgi:hypothetical protein